MMLHTHAGKKSFVLDRSNDILTVLCFINLIILIHFTIVLFIHSFIVLFIYLFFYLFIYLFFNLLIYPFLFIRSGIYISFVEKKQKNTKLQTVRSMNTTGILSINILLLRCHKVAFEISI